MPWKIFESKADWNWRYEASATERVRHLQDHESMWYWNLDITIAWSKDKVLVKKHLCAESVWEGVKQPKNDVFCTFSYNYIHITPMIWLLGSRAGTTSKLSLHPSPPLPLPLCPKESRPGLGKQCGVDIARTADINWWKGYSIQYDVMFSK